MTLPGIALIEADYAALERCWIPREVADAALLRRVDNVEGGAIIGRNRGGDYAGVVSPYKWPGEEHIREFRLRRDKPDIEYKDGKPKDKAKYLSPPGRSGMLYFPPNVEPAQLQDASLPIIIAEGEKETPALYRLSWHGLDSAERPRFLSIDIVHAWHWRGTVGKTSGPNGERRDLKGVLADFDRTAWSNRKVHLLFDANVDANRSVAVARLELAEELRSRGAEIYFPELPVEEGINGVDDFLARHGPEPALRLFDSARLFSPKEQLVVLPTTDHGAELAFDLNPAHSASWSVGQEADWRPSEAILVS